MRGMVQRSVNATELRFKKWPDVKVWRLCVSFVQVVDKTMRRRKKKNVNMLDRALYAVRRSRFRKLV